MIGTPAVSGFGSAFSDDSLNRVTAGFTEDNICGEGASCIVYRMRLGGIRVAVKRLRKECLTSAAHVASYRKEFEIGQRLKHDALPVYRDFHESFGEVYIVMDFVDGVSVEDFLMTDEGMAYFGSEENLRRFLSELLDAVGYMHRSGVIHCDLKPANIMLRHSDRGVMLLDLDKSYCDTMDLTHGGTVAGSAPLSAGEKPTAQKDFEAIGTILDEIAARVPRFPSSKLKRFRKECDNADATAESLTKALQPTRRKWVWIAPAVITAGVVACLLLLTSRSQTTDNPAADIIHSANDTPTGTSHSTKDTIVTIVQTEQAQPAPAPMPSIDFDSEMAAFTSSAQSALVRLASEEMSYDEILDLPYRITEDYTTAYSDIVTRTKEKCPDIPGIDVELMVAREAEKSRAMRLFQQVSQAIADAIQARQLR